MPAPLLEVGNLTVELRRGRVAEPILHGVSLGLAERQVLGIIGESGSGKTVLSQALINAVNPPLTITEGHVTFRGRDLLALTGAEMQSIRGSRIGYIGADPAGALDPTIPVGRQIVEKLRAVEPGLSRSGARDRVLDMLEAVRLPAPAQRFDEFPFQYSGGMMQRALIVDAMITRCDLVVADNVTQALDVTIAAQILRLLSELRERFGTAVAFISSSLPMVREIADEVIVLQEGSIIERSTPDALVTEPRHDYSKLLIDRIPRIWTAGIAAESPADRGGGRTILSVRDVAKTYEVRDPNRFFGVKHVQAVRAATFDITAGENFGIVGESGCGKSTLSRLLSWIEQPDRGQIIFDGDDMAGMSHRQLLAARRRFQLLLQDPFNSLPPHLSVGRIIAEGLLVHGGMTTRQARNRVLEVMDEVGVPREHFDQLPVGLSAGERQRINLARALVLEPELLILDETLSALDQVEQSRLLETFERLQARHSFTYVFISHDLAMVRRACSRIAVMYLGKVVELADNHTVFFNPGHPYTKALLSAVPTIEDRRYNPDECLLEGEPPNPIDIPPGCSFRTRCPLAFERCGHEEPVLTRRGNGGMSACYRAGTPPDRSSPASGTG